MTNGLAQQVAAIAMYNAWEERKSYQLTLPPKYAYLEPTDVIAIITDGITYIMRLIKTDMQRTGQMKLAISHKHSARNLKPFAPVHAKVAKCENDNINISWIRRARHDNGWRDNVDVPLGEESQHYEIDIIHNNGIIETITSNKPSIIYNNHQQIGNLVAVIYQISAFVGRGYPISINI